MVVEYQSKAAVTLTGIPADSGNGSYGFTAIPLPSTSGALTKLFLRPSPNKTKLIQLQFSSSDPAMIVNLDGCVIYLRAWGSTAAYEPVKMFGSQGGEG
jgi:hypothetical protein